MAIPGPTIAIIGAGFSGTTVAARLLRSRRPLRVVLISRFGPIGRGVAYGTSLDAHLLNVPAGSMSAFPEDPEHFLRFARTREPGLTAGSFVPRRLFGDYLESILREASATAAAETTFESIEAEAVELELATAGRGAKVVLSDSRALQADFVVLALGNYAPADLAFADPAFNSSDRYIHDPWVRGALDVIEPGERVLIIGTGLTMMDIAVDLVSERGIATPLHAVSTRGLLPQGHRPVAAASDPPPLELARNGRPPSMTRCLRTFRAHVAATGDDWRAAIGSIRGRTPRLWQALPVAERARFLRHVRPYWETHRHRAAPETSRAIRAMLDSGKLKITAGRVVGFESDARHVYASVRPRGATDPVGIRVTRVVNCTGPNSDVRRLRDPLMRSLVERGQIRPDSLGLGIDTTESGQVLDHAGRPSSALFLVGPLLKPRLWESTAVPELREHAANLVDRVLLG